MNKSGRMNTFTALTFPEHLALFAIYKADSNEYIKLTLVIYKRATIELYHSCRTKVHPVSCICVMSSFNDVCRYLPYFV